MVRLAFSSKYIYSLPEGHRFPIEKYELVKEQLVYEGTIDDDQLFDPGLIDEKAILDVHTRDYWHKLSSLSLDMKEVRRIGLPVTDISLKRAQNSVAGTVESARIALKTGIGINMAGGTHHAYADRGEGFCILNDIAISAIDLLNSCQVKRILIVDLDVHQGNGTAKIFENDNRVFTFSMHGENNYPLHKERSDLDIALPKDTTDKHYLGILNETLTQLICREMPDIIYYQAGVDVLSIDRLGKLGLTKEGVKKRDEMVIKSCKSHSIPLVITMGGGYSEKLIDLVDAHCNTFRTAISIY